MRYAAKLLIPSRRLAVINGYLNAEQEDEFQGEDNTIIHTVLFPDGKFMDIKCCGCQDESSWTEAVLFAKANGGGFSQVAYTEPDESYLGEWELEDEGNSYFVEVVDGGDIENLELARGRAVALAESSRTIERKPGHISPPKKRLWLSSATHPQNESCLLGIALRMQAYHEIKQR